MTSMGQLNSTVRTTTASYIWLVDHNSFELDSIDRKTTSLNTRLVYYDSFEFDSTFHKTTALYIWLVQWVCTVYTLQERLRNR